MKWLKDCPQCGEHSSMEYEDGEWYCINCGYSEEADEDDAEDEATAFTDDDDDSAPYGCRTCGNYDSGLYPDCLDSCPMGDD